MSTDYPLFHPSVIYFRKWPLIILLNKKAIPNITHLIGDSNKSNFDLTPVNDQYNSIVLYISGHYNNPIS
jgi:hypothetical protein